MRTSTILLVNLKGTATETIKNIVLAGIGTLVVVDGEDVSEEDLGAGFFFRDEDVGVKVRVFTRLGFLFPMIMFSIACYCREIQDRKPQPVGHGQNARIALCDRRQHIRGHIERAQCRLGLCYGLESRRSHPNE